MGGGRKREKERAGKEEVAGECEEKGVSREQGVEGGGDQGRGRE